MNPAPLIAVWMLLPCSSEVTTDPVTRVTTAEVCPYTFGEAAGPFLAKGWRPPQGASTPVQAKKPSKIKKKLYASKYSKKKKTKKSRRKS